jgi:thymidine phosphorylase
VKHDLPDPPFPALEARDVLAVLQGKHDAPDDLRSRACRLAGTVLELGGRAANGPASRWRRWPWQTEGPGPSSQCICEAQGGMRIPAAARHRHSLLASKSDRIVRMDNRKLARLAKLAGAPNAKTAGLELHVKLDQAVKSGDPICTVHAESRGEMAYALDYADAHADLMEIIPE